VFKTIQILFIGTTAALLLTACGPSEKDAQQLGFANVTEMKELQAKGFKTKDEYEASEAKKLGFQDVAEMKDLQSKGFKNKEEYQLAMQKKEDEFLAKIEQQFSKCAGQYSAKAPSDYKLFHCDNESRFLLKSKNKLPNDIYEITYIRDYKKQPILAPGLSYVAVQQVDCRDKKVKTFSTEYSGNLGSGKVLETKTYDWGDLPMEHDGPRDIYQAACSAWINYQMMN